MAIKPKIRLMEIKAYKSGLGVELLPSIYVDLDRNQRGRFLVVNFGWIKWFVDIKMYLWFL